MKRSAGILLYKIVRGKLQVLLVHPGGPFWKNKDEGAWSIPKGHIDEGESKDELIEVAKREFQEETGFKPEGPFTFIGSVRRESDGKTVDAWAFKGDCDPKELKSNTIMIEWPPKSGKQMEVPEIDRGEFFALPQARVKMHPYQVPIIDLFEKSLDL